MVVSKQAGNKLDAKFFSTEQGKLVILLVLLLVAAGVYFGFYAGSNSVEDVESSIPGNPNNISSPNTTNASATTSDDVVNNDHVPIETTASNASVGVKDVFRPLVKDMVANKDIPESKTTVIEDPVTFSIPDIQQPVKPIPKSEVESEKSDYNSNSQQVVAPEPKKTIAQLIDAKVTGIAGNAETMMAIMEVDGKSQTYYKGDIVKEDIKVHDITSHSVVLVKDSEKLEIQLGGK